MKIWSGKRDSNSRPRPWQGRALPTELFPHRVDAFASDDTHYHLDCDRSFFGAGNEIRTRDPDLGKVVLYQLSYSRIQKKALRFEVVRIVQKYFYLATINWIFLYKRTFTA